MDPVGVAASIITLSELASELVDFLHSVKNASSEQTRLRNEVTILSELLTALDRRRKDIEAEGEGFQTIRALVVDGRAVDQCYESLETLKGKSRKDKGFGIEKLGRNLLWHFGKKEVNEALMSVERLKSSLDLALTNDVSVLVQKMKINSDVLTRDVSGLKDDFKGQELDKECQELGDWVSPFNFSAMQQEILHRCHAGTGKWMLESENFQQWSRSHNETLWCPGIPGAGKTYLASIIVDYLQRQTSSQGQDAVLCLFCDFNQQANQTAYNFMGALLKQLAQAGRTLSSGFGRIHTARESGRRFDFKDLSDTFRTKLKRFSKTFIIIDALDEVSESADIRTILLKELRSCPINLLVTSRHDPTIKEQFSEAQRCDIRATDEDIRSYISERIEQENRLSRQLRSSPTLRDEIPAHIVGSAKGMFLLARFHMDEISNKTKPKQIEEALERLPPGLNENYNQTINRLRSQGSDGWELARNVLLWLSNALEPLDVRALQEAVAVESGMTSIGIRDLNDIESLISACAGLVVLEGGKEPSTSRLVHYTVQEYLEKNQAVLSPKPHADLAIACLAYLSLDEFSNEPPDCLLERPYRVLQAGHMVCEADYSIKNSVLQDRFMFGETIPFNNHYFTRYAALYWGYHAQRAGDEVMVAVIDFLSRPANVAYNWLVLKFKDIFVTFGKPLGYEEMMEDAELFRMLLAVHFGLENVLGELLKTHTRPADNAPDPVISRVACHAARRGHRGMIRLLLTQKNVDWNTCDFLGDNLLLLVAGGNDEDNLRILLQEGSCSVNALTGVEHALHHAVIRGCISTTRILLEAGAAAEARGKSWPIIAYAAGCLYKSYCWDEMMDLLLEYDADINAQGGRQGHTALHETAFMSWKGIHAVEYLVSKGANLNILSEKGDTPLDLVEQHMAYGDELGKEGAAKIIQILRTAGGKRASEVLQPAERKAIQARWNLKYPMNPIVSSPQTQTQTHFNTVSETPCVTGTPSVAELPRQWDSEWRKHQFNAPSSIGRNALSLDDFSAWYRNLRGVSQASPQ